MAVLKQAYHCSSGLNAGVKGLFCYKKKIKKRDESMGGALWKDFYLNILSKLWCSFENSFLPTPLEWIQALYKKSIFDWEKTE